MDSSGIITLDSSISTVNSVYNTTAAGNWNDTSKWTNTPAVTAFPNNGGGTIYNATINGNGSTPVSLTTNITVNNLGLANAALLGTAPDGVTVQPTPTTLTVNSFFTGGNFALQQGLALNLAGTSTENGNNISGDANASVTIAPGGTLTYPGSGGLFIQHPHERQRHPRRHRLWRSDPPQRRPGTHAGTFNISSGT